MKNLFTLLVLALVSGSAFSVPLTCKAWIGGRLFGVPCPAVVKRPIVVSPGAKRHAVEVARMLVK